MTYQPRPIDTSRISLGALQSLAEYLAEQAHEVWAKQRVDEGWTFGPVRDDGKKQTPDLVTYSDLPESERNYDRKVTEQTVKLIIERGYTIEPPAIRVPLPAHERIPTDQDDMVDREEIKQLQERISAGDTELAPLVEALEFFQDAFHKTYHTADFEAARLQKQYLRASLWCTLFAGLAVLLALIQLAGFELMEAPYLLPQLELGLVVFAVLLVPISYRFNWQNGWLINRSKAERFRELKFSTILDPSFWQPATKEKRKAEFQAAARDIDSIETDEVPPDLFDASTGGEISKVLTDSYKLDVAIASYYLRRRLSVQARYLKHKSHQFHEQDSRTKTIGVVLFFAVIVFVFAHATIEVIGDNQNGLTPILGRVLIALAAAIPALGATLRVYRGGREAGRNHIRSQATYRILNHLQGDLEAADSVPAQIKAMVRTESVLATEHRQWLQLMSECEWFG